MTDALPAPPLAIKTASDVDRLLGRWAQLQTEAESFEAQRDALVDVISAHTAEATNPLRIEQQAILDAVASYLQSRRSSWIRRFGRTATLDNGVIKWRIIGASLITPKNTKRIIEELLKMRGGKKFITLTPSINRDALKNASPRVLRRLKPYGVRVTRQETLSVKIGGRKPIMLRLMPYPRTKP